MLSDIQKSNLRRHLGYPVSGLYRTSINGQTVADGANGNRYFTAYGALEWRMNNLMPDEEARLVGAAYAAVAITGNPQTGDTLELAFTGGGLGALNDPTKLSGVVDVAAGASTKDIPFLGNPPYSFVAMPNWNTTVSVDDQRANGATVGFGSPAPAGAKIYWVMNTFTASDPGVSVVLLVTMPTSDPDINVNQLRMTQAIVLAVLANNLMVPAKFYVVSPYGMGPYAGRIYPNPITALTNPLPFTMNITNQVTRVGAQLQAGGDLLSPQVVLNEGTPQQASVHGYLNILDLLEGAQAGSTENLDTAKADVWTARPDEIRQRLALYEQWRGKTAMFMGTPLGESNYAIQRGIRNISGRLLV